MSRALGRVLALAALAVALGLLVAGLVLIAGQATP